MIDLLPALLDRPCELGKVVEVTNGPISGIRGVLTKIADDGKVIIQLDKKQGVFLVVAAENVRLEGSRDLRPESLLATAEI